MAAIAGHTALRHSRPAPHGLSPHRKVARLLSAERIPLEDVDEREILALRGHRPLRLILRTRRTLDTEADTPDPETLMDLLEDRAVVYAKRDSERADARRIASRMDLEAALAVCEAGKPVAEAIV